MTSRGSFESAVEETEKRYGLGPAAQQQQKYFDRFRGLPFWIPDKEKHEAAYDRWLAKSYSDPKGSKPCCFWHALGLPEKNGTPMPMFDYEQQIYEALQAHPYLWIKKATGLGITEFFLRLMTWLCLKDDEFKDSQFCIVTGPRIDLAITLIKRLKMLFTDYSFTEKETTLVLNNVLIEAFPSHHLDAMRGLKNVKFILLDEGDFLPINQQQDARDVMERYIAKSSPYLVMISTPNGPEQLFQSIEQEEHCLYHRMVLPYTVGVGKIYTKEEIQEARASPSFPREYECQYIGVQGNVFSPKSIETAIELGGKLEAARKGGIPYDMQKSMGVDAGFGSSKFGICVTAINRHNIIETLYAEEFDKPNFQDMIDEIINIRRNFNVSKLYVDDANPEVIRALKFAYGEQQDWHQVMLKHKHDWIHWMNIIPVSFRSEHKEMLAHLKRFLDSESFAVSPTKFNKLVIALRTSVATEGSLNKELTSHDDLIDALRLSMKCWSVKTEKVIA
jgi:hypothetical protein